MSGEQTQDATGTLQRSNSLTQLYQSILEEPPTSAADEFFTTEPAPKHIDQVKAELSTFVDKAIEAKENVVLITSGGTIVPLETRMVRYLDNFSGGTRGAVSAECFLEQGYRVIFLHREFSLEPYKRLFSNSTNCFLDFLQEDGGNVIIDHDHATSVRSTLQRYTHYRSTHRLHTITFTSITDYLHLLRAAAHALRPLRARALVYLAAAVSDFYLPAELTTEHKIQSSHAGLQLSLLPVPKMIGKLAQEWAPDACIASFKLETDPEILIPKCQRSLQAYGHTLVIGNLLHTRKDLVYLVQRREGEAEEVQVDEIRRSAQEQQDNTDIEPRLVQGVTGIHSTFVHEQRAAAAINDPFDV